MALSTVGDWIVADPPPGLVWVATYPRSGTTMVLMMMAQRLGLDTATVYAEIVFDGYYHDMLRQAQDLDTAAVAAKQSVFPAKTHELPPDDDRPAIIVVRDGRAVVSSMYEFYPAMCSLEYTLEDIISGESRWGDWTGWIRAWQAPGRRKLWLKYEDMIADPDHAAGQIAEFVGLSPGEGREPDFPALHKTNPWMFRRGKVDHTLRPEHEEMFWERHGDTMTSLGYER